MNIYRSARSRRNASFFVRYVSGTICRALERLTSYIGVPATCQNEVSELFCVDMPS